MCFPQCNRVSIGQARGSSFSAPWTAQHEHRQLASKRVVQMLT